VNDVERARHGGAGASVHTLLSYRLQLEIACTLYSADGTAIGSPPFGPLPATGWPKSRKSVRVALRGFCESRTHAPMGWITDMSVFEFR
jgi:hypothetical protein